MALGGKRTLVKDDQMLVLMENVKSVLNRSELLRRGGVRSDNLEDVVGLDLKGRQTLLDPNSSALMGVNTGR